jgi:hypothetical protein
MKARLALATALFGTLVASPAFAQDTTDQPPADAPPVAAVESSAQPAKKISLGAQIELLPVGSMDLSISGPVINGSDSTDTSTAFGLGGTVAYDIAPNFSIGAAPRLLFNVQGENAKESAKELDLRARLAVHGEIAPQVQLYAYASPGYSWFIPSKGDNSNGFALGGGAGASFDIGSDAFVNAELGYQRAFISEESEGTTVDLDVSYLHIGVGGGTRF